MVGAVVVGRLVGVTVVGLPRETAAPFCRNWTNVVGLFRAMKLLRSSNGTLCERSLLAALCLGASAGNGGNSSRSNTGGGTNATILGCSTDSVTGADFSSADNGGSRSFDGRAHFLKSLL